MVLSLPILTLLCCSAMMCAGTAAAAGIGLSVVVGWNPAESDPRQLGRERRRLLAESFVQAVLAWELLSLFLFVAAADRLHPLFTGAMCAAGTLNANPYGWPTLVAKITAFLAAGVWLLVDRATRDLQERSLVSFKHLSLLLLLVLVVTENLLQVLYFTGLDPDVLTSCCGTIFTDDAPGVGGSLAGLPPAPTLSLFALLLGLAMVTGPTSRRWPGLVPAFALLAGLLGLVALASVVSWLAPAVYRLPSHHCPFCLLDREHLYVGYLIYAALFTGAVSGLAAGAVHLLRRWDRAREMPDGVEHRLVRTAVLAFGVLGLLALVVLLRAGPNLVGP